MITLPSSQREWRRVDMVRSFELFDRPRPPQHNEIAALAQELARTPWALVSLIDAERIWFSGAANHAEAESSRWSSFCTHVIKTPDRTTWVADAQADIRFSQLPSVTDTPYLRFYAGAPICVNGHAIGTVCVFDTEPRAFDRSLAQSLARLAAIVGEDLAARHRERALHTALLASADALIECDNDGVITRWSDGASQLFGFTAEEGVGSNIDLIIPAEKKAAHHHAFDRWRVSGSARVGRRIDLQALRKDGSSIDIVLWMSIAHVHGVPHIHANIRDISERTAQAAALRRATAEAEAANRAKTIFLTTMSHELRTPLNGVIGAADLLAQTALSEHQRELTSIIHSSWEQLRRLVGDILDLGCIDAGELELDDAPMALVELVTDVASVARLAADAKRVALRTLIAPDIPLTVMGDLVRIQQVLTNLVANAVKFTSHGSVVMRLDRQGDTYRFEVSDTGIGFSEQERSTIFGRFQQADGTITRRFGGSGLGLAICSELVAAMGGELHCRSTPKEGSSFWFTISLAEPRQEKEELPAQIEADAKACRVLIVDDNPTNRRVAELILQTIGADVTGAEDGDQAVDAFLSASFDVILMDMMMPVMDGLAATRAIRDIEARESRIPTPIIMLTANSLPHHIDDSLDAGADMHLSKPVSIQSLLGALINVCRTSEADPVSEAAA